MTDPQASQAEPDTVDGELAAIRGGRPDTPKEHVLSGLLNTIFRHYDENAAQILVDSQAEQAQDQKMFDKEDELLKNRPAASIAGVDLAAVKAADPDFDDQGFLTIVRDTFDRVRQARSQDDPQFTDAALSPTLAAQLKTVISGDVASHRHHLLPGLEIRTAQIQSAAVVDGKIQIVVGLHLRSEEVDLDAAGTVIAGDYTDREWDEVWTFIRDPSIDTPAFDAALIDVPLDRGGWLFAHKGWIVTSIARVGAADPLDPSNL